MTIMTEALWSPGRILCSNSGPTNHFCWRELRPRSGGRKSGDHRALSRMDSAADAAMIGRLGKRALFVRSLTLRTRTKKEKSV